MPPRTIRPKDESSSNEQQSDRSTAKSSKRRVVPSACIPCRRRKSKCDGGLPACSTCVAVYRTECSYDPDSGDARPRSNAQRDVQSLQQRNDALDVIVASLRALPEAEAVGLLHSLRTTPNMDMVATLARSGDARSPFSRSTTTSESSSLTRSAPASDSGAHISRTPAPDMLARTPTSDPFHNRTEASFNGPSEAHLDLSFTDGVQSPSVAPSSPFPLGSKSTARADDRCAAILLDPGNVTYLLDIYFAWIHPFNQLFNKEHFLLDLRNDASNSFKTLLYAVLAVSCLYTDQIPSLGESMPATNLGDYSFQQAEALLAVVDKPHLAIVQALGIMGLRESSCGRDSRAYQYVGRCIRTAVELNLHSLKTASTLSPLEVEARQVTLWGVYTLETLCAMHAGRPSQLSRSIIDLPKPIPDERAELQEWRASGHELAASFEQHGQPLHLTLFTDILSDLCEMSSSVLDILFSPSQNFTSRSLVSAYEKYVAWYANVPRSFWPGHRSLPHVVVLHIFYNMCILSLFRPYIKLDLRGANLFPRETCTQSANEISRLVGELRNVYGLRRVPMVIVHALIAASTVHILNLPSDLASTNLRQALEDLTTLSTNHSCAINGINLVQSLANRWAVRLPQEVSPSFSPRTMMRAQQTAATGAVSAQTGSESYGVLYDHLGGSEDVHLQTVSWPSTPSFPIPQSATPDGMMDVTGSISSSWHQAQHQQAHQQTQHQHAHQHPALHLQPHHQQALQQSRGQDQDRSAAQSMQSMPWQWNS